MNIEDVKFVSNTKTEKRGEGRSYVSKMGESTALK